MSTTKSQAQVSREFQGTGVTPLPAFIVGPRAALHRHAVASEKAAASLGAYDPGSVTVYDWPGKEDDSLVDLASVSLFVDDALLRYFQDAIGSGGLVAPVSGRANRVRSNSVVFKTLNGVSRDALLYDRDVKVGDRAMVRAVGGDSNVHTLNTYVAGFAAEVAAAVTGAAAAGTGNRGPQTLATSVDKLAGADNAIELTVDGTGYDGLETGDVDEYYTIEVTLGSVGEDLTTARLRVTSASGLDDDASVTPVHAGGHTPIGSRGLLVQFDIAPSTSASSAAMLDDAAPNDLVTGQRWRVHVKQAFTPPTAHSSGTYAGLKDTTYVLQVTKGGTFGESPEVTAYTTTGYDSSGPTAVTASGFSFPVGSHGVMANFTGAALCTDDLFYIVATAPADAGVQTLVLGHDLPTELSGVSDLLLELYIRKNAVVPADRAGHAPAVNWAAAQDGFTVQSGVLSSDDSWTDSGVKLDLPVVGGNLVLQYREWLPSNSSALGASVDDADVAADLGEATPDNPLAYGVSKAVLNASGTPVRWAVVSDPGSLSSWKAALRVGDGRVDCYGVVPLTQHPEVLSWCSARVKAVSDSGKGLVRRCLLSQAAHDVHALADASLSSDGDPLLATLSDDPDAAGTQYTLLRVTSGNAELVSLGVAAGDTVRYLFTTDGFGNPAYTEFTVASVLSETSVLLTAGGDHALGVAQRVEFWRTASSDAVAADYKARSVAYASDRVSVVWPPTLEDQGTEVFGYFLAAALAGLRSGALPHQDLTGVQVLGFDAMPWSTEKLTADQVQDLADGGVWAVSIDADGLAYSVGSSTTDTETTDSADEGLRANVDSAEFAIRGPLRRTAGQANLTDSNMIAIGTAVRGVIEHLKSTSFTETLGSQINDGVITDLRKSTVDAGVIVLAVVLDLPRAVRGTTLEIAF